MAENVKITISALDKTKKGFGSATKGLKAVAGAVLNAKTAIVGLVGAAGFGLLISRSLQATDTLTKTANKIGTTTEALGALRYAADLTGVSTQTMDMALQRFTRRTAEAAQGMGEAKGAIKELGINAQELNRMPLDERMIVLADAFQNVQSESDRLRLAFKLFDSEGAALVNTLSQGSDGLKAMLGEAKALGLTMSSSAAKGVEDTVDSLTKLQSLFKGVTDQVVAAFAPALEAIVVRLTAFMQESIKAKGGVENFARAIAVDLLGGVQIALQAFEDLANGFISVYNTALRTKDALTNVFTKDEEKNARQLRQEIQKINKDMQERGDRLNAENAHKKYNFTLTKNQQRADAERLVILNGLLLKAKESNDELGLLAKKDFASGLNAQIQAIRDSLGQVSNVIPEFTAPAIESISDLRLGFKSWSDSLPSMQENVQNLTKQGLDGLTDSLTAGITGAANFADAMKSMAKSVVDSLIKMLVQKYIVDAAFGFITTKIAGFGQSTSNIEGSADFVGPMQPKALGGPVQGKSPYLVGERGPELFIPNSNGSIIPNNQMGGGGGVVVNQTINVTTGVQQTVRAEIATLMPQIANAAKGAVADARMRGGGYSKALVGA
ncbi:MAG: hypothetical protein CMJ25_07205 [Phycisphaerae bacterium]|nr:hypothetical protein [Phycisphaerae bacterium]